MKTNESTYRPAEQGESPTGTNTQGEFEVVVVSLGGLADPALPIAAARAGHLGLLDLGEVTDVERATEALTRLQRRGRGPVGVILRPSDEELTRSILSRVRGQDTVVFRVWDGAPLRPLVRLARASALRVGCVLVSPDQVETAEKAGVDFILAKGHEAGGFVGDLTLYVLVQQMLRDCTLPIYAWGGIGASTAAACRVAGVRGVVLDWQLSLLKESPLGDDMKARIRRMDGSECAALPVGDRRYLRLYHQPSFSAYEALLRVAEREADGHCGDVEAALRERLAESVRTEDRAWLMGQDACMASVVAGEFPSVGRYLPALVAEVSRLVEAVAVSGAVGPGSSMAKSLGTTYPVIQGPMTRVSDVPAFCAAIADGGGLPFLALALIRAPGVRTMMEETRSLLGDRPWGVGVLGFVPKALRDEQMAIVEEIRPPFAIIAGGRPDQAAALEAKGIATFLHVPSPGMLAMYLQEGARRFIFEGAECGGHVGPRTSFVLWESMVQVLVDAELPRAEAERVQVFFAGGIHDSVSAAMAATVAQPLLERGMKFGVVMGTAYLFTEEAVATGAIVEEFQRVALLTRSTVLAETGPGHAIRCAPTNFHVEFERRKRELRAAGVSPAEIREQLEHSNMGRLRVASKAVARDADVREGDVRYAAVDLETQRRDGMYMIGQVAAMHNQVLTVRMLHEEVFDGAAARLEAVADAPRLEAPASRRAAEPYDIAIVGMSCLLPGGATDVDRYWENILAKKDAVGEVPPHRFDASLWYAEDRSARDRIYSKWGGFLEDLPFDPLRYGIPPAALRSIEPMQLLALEMVDQALRHAGYRDNNPYRERTSVILGAGGGAAELGGKYAFRSMLPEYAVQVDPALLDALPEWTEDSFAGILLNVIAGRVTNRFDLGGCNFTVDAACASSLAAVYLGCKELATRTSDMVICGGCDTIQSPFGYLCFSKTNALSPTGRSRSFDAEADGIATSEGHAAVVLKRLEDAERDGDTVYAVIRGAAGGSDGRSMGLTAPRMEGQVRTLHRAYAQADISPATVGYFEAHATGTRVGDETEGRAISRLLEEHGARKASVGIGSVKSMIGHTKCAAGVAGLIKTALALYHRVLPPTLHVSQPNPKAGLVDGPLYVNTEVRPWLAGETPRRAGVSAFGFGGSNFHVVVEEYTDEPVSRLRQSPRRWRAAELFVFGAETEEALAGQVRELAGQIRTGETALCDLAYRHFKRAGGGSGGVRAAVVAEGTEDLRARLEALGAHLAAGAGDRPALPARVYYQARPLGADAPIAFLFPGQGAQFPGMLQDLAIEFSEVSGALEQADHVLQGTFDRPLSQYVLPPPLFSDTERAQAAEALQATNITQPALGACSVGMLRLLRSFGIEPAMTAGQSYGELVALHAAGCLDEDSLYRLSWARGRAIVRAIQLSESTDMGRMLAVVASEEEIRARIQDRSNVWIANLNSPSQTVLSGTAAGIEGILPVLEQAGLSCQRVPVSCAFHSPIMAPARAEFEETLARTNFTSSTLPVFSNTTAEPYISTPQRIRHVLADQLTHEVRFFEEIRAMFESGARIFLEVGPNRLLTRFAGQILAELPHAAIPTNVKGAPAISQFLMALAELYSHGVPMRLDRLFEGRGLRTAPPPVPGDAAKNAHLWLVNGSYARPAQEPPRLMKPSFSIRSSPEGEQMTHSAADAPFVPSVDPAPVSAAPRAVPVSAPMDPQAFAAYQETMRLFLLTQQAVMQAYLGGAPDPAPAGAVLPQLEVAPAAVQAPPPPSARVPAPAPESAEATGPVEATAAASRSLEAILRGVVAERTGYPEDMVDPAANLEADLGIDSIKRVEIVAAFRRRVLPGMQEPPAAFMERMTGAATAQEILDVVRDYLGEGSPAPVGAAAAIPEIPGVVREEAGESAPVVAGPAEAMDAVLIGLVAERTGYPPEMLDPDAHLEADLGIDSIKRVEIIAAFRRRILPGMQEPPAEFMERMTAAASIRQILEVAAAHAGAPVSVPVAAAPAPRGAVEEAAGADAGCPRCVVEVVPACGSEDPGRPPVGHWLLTDDGGGLAAAVMEALAQGGSTAAMLAPDALRSRESAEAAVGAARQAGRLAGLLHLAPLQAAAAYPGISPDAWDARTAEEVTGLLHLLQALAPELSGGSGRVVALTRGGGDFGAGGPGECAQPWRGGIAGLLKVAALEWTQAVFHALDIDGDVGADEVLRQAALPAGPVETGLRNGVRLALRVRRKERDAGVEAESVPLGAEDVVLVTGGARGITAEVVHEMATHVPCTYVLLGRSPLPDRPEDAETLRESDPIALRRILSASQRRAGGSPSPREIDQDVRRLLAAREIRRTLDRLREAGANAAYQVCDVADPASLTSAVHEAEAAFGPITGLIHGAGVIEDKYIADKTGASFRRVWDTKIQPLLTLTGLLEPEAMKLLVLFSSTAGFFGNPGQSDYAAANETLNRAARRLSDLWPARVVALNWGPWEGAGMVTAEVARQFRERGVGLVPVPAGREAAWREVSRAARDGVRILLGPGAWVEDAPAAPVATAFPLLEGQVVVARPDHSLEATVTLDAGRHRYLRDHQIDEKPVLPFAVALEMMGELAAAGRPDLEVVRVESIRQFKGIVLENGPQQVLLTAHPEENAPDRARWRVSVSDPAVPNRKRYEATVILAAALPAPPAAPPLDPIANGFPLSVEEAYHQWLFHGAAYQMITRLDGLAPEGIDAEVNPSDVAFVMGAESGSGWLMDPPVLDVGPQLAALWARGQFDTTPLPYQAAAWERYGPLRGAPLTCRFRIAPGSEGSTLKADVWYLRDGVVVGRMAGLECAGSTELNRITGKSLALR